MKVSVLEVVFQVPGNMLKNIFALNTIEKDGSKLILIIQLFLLRNPYPIHIPPLMGHLAPSPDDLQEPPEPLN